MFDIGFFELTLIGIVALLVVGPEKLPRLAKTGGMWVGKARRFVSTVKSDIEQELKAEELKKILDLQKDSNPFHEIIEDTKQQFQDIKTQTEKTLADPDKADADKKDQASTD